MATANIKISQLPSLSTMTNAAIMPVVANGVTQQISGANLSAFFGGYGNANVVTLLGNLGSNTVSTSGNITGNYFIGNGSLLTGISAGANTGNVTFSGETVIGTGTSNLISGLYLAPSSSSANASMYLRVRGNINDEPTHIHFDTGNNAYYNQFIGDDNKYIQLANTGNIIINSNDGVGNSAQWTFGTDGNLTLPGNTSSINYANGSPYGGGSGSITLQPNDVTYTSGSLYGNANPGFTVVTTGDDDSAYDIPVDFPIEFLGNTYSSGNVFLVSNSYLTFGPVDYTDYHPVGPGIVPVPAIYMGAADLGNQKYYYGYAEGTDIFVIGYEGSASTGGQQDYPGITWELQVSAATPDELKLVVGTADQAPGGVWGVSNGVAWVDQFHPLPWFSNYADNTFDSIVIAPVVPMAATNIAFVGPGVTIGEDSGTTYVNIDPFDSVISVNDNGDTGATISSVYYDLTLTTARDGDDINILPKGRVYIEGGSGSDNQPGDGQRVEIRGGNAHVNPNAPGQNFNGGNVDIHAGFNVNAGLLGNIRLHTNDDTHQWTFRGDGKITLPHGASLNDTSGDSVAFGQNAGLTSQAQHAVAIGRDAGSLYQGEDSIAIGYQSGYQNQSRGVAIGYQAGYGGTLYRSVSDAQGGSGPVTTYFPAQAPNPSRLYVASTTNIETNQRVFGNNIQANTVVTAVYPGEDRVDITPNYTAAMSEGDPLTFVGLVIGVDDASNLVYPMRVTGTDIPANTFVQSTGCSVVTLSQYPTAPLTNGASLTFTIGQGAYSTAVGYQAGYSFQGDGAVAIGYSAGRQNQSIRAVAVGEFAGYSNQSANAVAVGQSAGEFTQAVNAVAVGYKAGYYQQSPRAVAIGEDAGYNLQGEDAVAIGQKAGQFSQGRFSVAIGNTAGTSGQGERTVAIGYGTGLISQQYSAVAIGANAASYNQGSTAVAVGRLAGNTSQGASAVAVGVAAGYNNQQNDAVAIGGQSGYNYQGGAAVAIGSAAGQGQGYSAVYQSGTGTAITITPNAYIQIGQRITGQYVPADTYVADIDGASLTLTQAITGTPAVDTVWTAWGQQGTGAVAVGQNAGLDFQGNSAVAIGNSSGSLNQSANAVAIGYQAGFEAQGANSIAIGTLAGQSAQGNNSIVINATGSAVGSTSDDNTFTVAPVRNDVANVGEVMFYNTTSKEITYGNTISVAGNVSTPIVYSQGMAVQGYDFVQMQYSNAVALPVSPYDIGTGSWFYLDTSGGTFESNTTGTLKTVVLGNDGSVSAMGNITGGNLSAVNLVINSISSDDSSFITIEDGVNISSGAISSQENLSLTANAYTWTFRNDGIGIVLPYSATIRDTNIGALAIGYQAGFLSQANTAVAIGYQAGLTSQGGGAVAIGRSAGNSQSDFAVAIGSYAGVTNQGNAAVAVGKEAGNISQGNDAVAVGSGAGYQGQGIQAVAIGGSAGAVNQGVYAIAIGAAAGAAGNSAVAIGVSSGFSNQGNFAVAIGASAGATNQGNNSIILNATGAALNQTVANTFTVAPVRNDVANTAQVMFYNATSKEITYGNTISVAGNITGGNLNAAGLSLSSNVVSALNVTPNIAGGNITTPGLISATGNITGGNIMGGANVNATTHTGTTVSVSANVTGGNILFGSGIVSGTGNITGGNIMGGANVNATTHTGTTVSVTGNITGGNLAISGNSATITSANYSVGYLNIPQISFAANATAALVDSGKHYYITSASNLALTLADNSAVSWPVGTALSIVNRGTANVTVAPAAGVSLYLAGNSTSANRVVTTYGMATVMNVAANVWMINGTVV